MMILKLNPPSMPSTAICSLSTHLVQENHPYIVWDPTSLPSVNNIYIDAVLAILFDKVKKLEEEVKSSKKEIELLKSRPLNLLGHFGED
jgi:hypothetical protein